MKKRIVMFVMGCPAEIAVAALEGSSGNVVEAMHRIQAARLAQIITQSLRLYQDPREVEVRPEGLN